MGVLAACGESFWCNRVLDVASLGAAALERRAAMQGTAVAARVIGHHPAYLQVAEAIGAKAFDIPQKVWEGMSEGARRAANARFLDRGIQEGAEFDLATARSEIRSGSTLEREVNYLLERGYAWPSNGMSLVPK